MRHRDVMASSFGEELQSDSDSFDPTEGLSNLADCMLVLACGLMVALVVKFGVNVTPDLVEVEDSESLVHVEETDVSEAVISDSAENSESTNMYQELGMLYKDPSTGKMYYLSEGEGE